MANVQASPPDNILIIGGGSAGWMTASTLLRSLGTVGSKITLVESSNISTIGVGEGTTPFFKRFLNFSQIPEDEFMAACKATFKLGINFPGWTNSEEFKAYFHPFASPGYSQYEPEFFSNCDRRRKGEKRGTNPGDYFFNAELAAQCKSPIGPPPIDSSTIDYAYHFDTALLADLLKKRCLAQGINYVVDDVGDVVVGEDGNISHVSTANHGDLAADFFVDCTGFRRKLIGKITSDQPISYKPRLFNDRAVVIRTPVSQDEEMYPYTESRALKCGWAWRIPLLGKISWGYVYSADHTSQDDAEAELRESIGESADGVEPLYIKLQTGRVHEHWKNNCVAIGLSQGFIEPLEATALGLTQFSINRFVTHFSRGGFTADYRDHYNDIVNEAFDCTIDYIQMHYKLTTRTDTQYWRDCAENENLSDTMRAIISGWESESADFISVLRTHVHRSSYAPYSWYCILSGMGRFDKSTMGSDLLGTPNRYEKDVSNFFGHRQYIQSLRGRA